jgi:nitrite reductase (NAD(P)H)
VIPPNTPGSDLKGVFVYRTIGDLQNMLNYSRAVTANRRAVVIGGGLLGLEAAHAVYCMDVFEDVEVLQS